MQNLARAIDELSVEVNGLSAEVKGEREDRKAERRADRTRFAVILAVIVLVGGVVMWWNRHDVSRASNELRGIIATDCPQHKALGESQIQPWTSQFGRNIVLFNRASYEKKCLGRDGYGPLGPPDPDLSRPIQPSPTPRP